MQVAQELIDKVRSGEYRVGSKIPTEAALCEQYGVSRFTARQALQRLSDAGLVIRRPGMGTRVIAPPDESRYTHSVVSLPTLLQYAQTTTLDFAFIGRVPLDRRTAIELKAELGQEWVFAVGLRMDRSRGDAKHAVCITRLWLNPTLEGIENMLREHDGPVYSLLETAFGRSIKRVEQEIEGVLLDASDAANLGCAAGDAALRVIRRYYDQYGELLEMTDNIHPADRFRYRVELHK